MSGELFASTLVVGLNLACFYMLIALGLTLMFGICGIVNMSHGVFYMLGAFGVFYMVTSLGHLNFFLALVLVMVIIGIIGLIMEKGILRTINWEFAPTIVITIGFAILLESVGYLVFGTIARGVPSPIEGVADIFGVRISYYRLAILPITLSLAGGLYYLIYRTRLGLAMRATEEDKMAAALQGINPNRVNSIVFFLGFALAAAAGVLMAPIYSVSPSMGAMPLLKAFMVIILGGMGSVHGAAVGALIIGLLDAFLSVTIGIDLAYLVGWGAIIVILIFKPRGLLGAY